MGLFRVSYNKREDSLINAVTVGELAGEAHNTDSRIGRMPDGGTITQDTHSLQCIVKGERSRKVSISLFQRINSDC